MSKSKAFSNENNPLTPPILYILLALASKDRHGYEIMKQVAQDSQGRIALGPGTLYGAIKRMLEDELILELETDDPRRRYYCLTEKGRSILTKELQRYHEAVEVAKARQIWRNAAANFEMEEA